MKRLEETRGELEKDTGRKIECVEFDFKNNADWKAYESLCNGI